MGKFKEYLIEGKNVGDLYHFTYYSSLESILKNNKMHSTSYDKQYTGKEGVSFTRNKNLKLGSPVCLVIDGNKISNKYKIFPIGTNYIETYEDDENEERVITKEIKDIRKYIKKIILFPNMIGYKHSWVDDGKMIIEKIKNYNIPIEINYKRKR